MTTQTERDQLRVIHDERLKEFIDQTTDHYEEKHIGDLWHIKHWNGSNHKWQVSIYTEDSFKRYKGYKISNDKQICSTTH